MIEIYIIYRITKYIGQLAERKHLKKVRYQVMAVLLWIIGEITGALIGGVVFEDKGLGWWYGFTLFWGGIGALIAIGVIKVIPGRIDQGDVLENAIIEEGFSIQKFSQSVWVPAIVTVLVAGCAFVSFIGVGFYQWLSEPSFFSDNDTPPSGPYEFADVYTDLRSSVLSANPEEIELDVDPNEPFGVLMEVGVSDGVFTVTSFLTGDASIYFSTGGGILGGIGYDAVRAASKDFVLETEKHIMNMEKVDEFPHPEFGEVRFYVLTKNGVYSSLFVESDIINQDHPMSGLYNAGDDVIAELRRVMTIDGIVNGTQP